MAQKKTTKNTRPAAQRTAARSVSGKKKTAAAPFAARSRQSQEEKKRIDAQMQAKEKRREEYRTVWSQSAPYLLIVAAVLLLIFFFTGGSKDAGALTKIVYDLMTGIFSVSAIVIPVFLIFAGVSELLDKGDNIIGTRTVFAMISSVLFAVLFELISKTGNGFSVMKMWEDGTKLKGGGVVGGMIGQLFLFCFKSVISYVIVIALLLLAVLLTFGITPKKLVQWFGKKIADLRKSLAESAAERPEKPRREENYGGDYYEDYDEGYGEGYADEGQYVEYADEAGNYYQPAAPVDEFDEDPFLPRTFADPGYNGRRIRRGAKFDTDVPIDDDYADDDFVESEDTETPEEKRERIEREKYNDVMRNARMNKSQAEIDAENSVFGIEPGAIPSAQEEILPEESPEEDALGKEILDQLADEYMEGEKDSALKVTREPVSAEEVKLEQVPIKLPKPEYKYPPIDLLAEGTGSVKAQNVREELHDNAAKLVSVLASFNVKTKIVGVSRGPTITRYELLPEPGTRVKSISNLVDDIALNLATSGVRIEAPIPGKAAVGIEVPNKTAETVYLRSLIADKEFSEHKSKIASALGKDVAGSSVIMDIQKMPHLLIAGATGMGKSVCINSILVSLLYRATPDDLKLLLIDPKKVEFSVYNGLPHLLVPVVSDPKKAAGSLTWAVNEMERRFGLIESVGVRDIDGFNKITANDPEKEHMPRIIIVIDELADLMSTAPDDVETSISRLAAKARAAGMHLVIGTQRPSVDVITGVIKANIPSRIACTVASQVDSRTIIDRSGAESLIGRGDMLYNPVGAAKPLRVQGAFVSESEVESVVTFIKANNLEGAAEYSDEVMKQIEAEAALCGVKKGSGGISAPDGAAGDGDPLIDQALEVAFESGKISTSLLQRRLSVGYGRAAKIIDKMEELGYVSAPDGQKPRQLLITKQDYMELKLKKEDGE